MGICVYYVWRYCINIGFGKDEKAEVAVQQIHRTGPHIGLERSFTYDRKSDHIVVKVPTEFF